MQASPLLNNNYSCPVIDASFLDREAPVVNGRSGGDVRAWHALGLPPLELALQPVRHCACKHVVAYAENVASAWPVREQRRQNRSSGKTDGQRN